MMVTKLCLRARPHFLSSRSLSLPLPKPSLLLRFRPFSVKMSAQIVEHIVLFKVKPETDPSKIDSMVAGLAGLSTLDPVLHLSVGPLHRNRSPAFSFTHMLHSRYKSKDDLDAYSGHPAHVSVVTERVRPICEDVMAVDWVSDGLAGPVAPRVGSAMRVTFLKLKEGLGEKERGEVLSVIGGVKDGFPATEQISYGENFSPARAKGFSIGSIAVLPGVSELEALDADSDLAESMKNKVRDLLESVIVLDYVIPQQQSASL